MEPIEVVIIVLSLALVAFVSYELYRKVRIARSGPPKSVTVRRSQVSGDRAKMETKEPRVIGMINCEYCGSLMPQTALTCPNCGASRKK
jgi:rubrerythrin